ncbi:MAG: hypothetical protein Q8M01_03315 [Rubrivivax sp.]|nr:hypothetical protein [Rubrivivax sp.]
MRYRTLGPMLCSMPAHWGRDTVNSEAGDKAWIAQRRREVALLIDAQGDNPYRAAAVGEMLATGGWRQLDRLRGDADPEVLLRTVPRVGAGLAHRLHDWVVLYGEDKDHGERRYTVVTAQRGPLAGRRIVRGRASRPRASCTPISSSSASACPTWTAPRRCGHCASSHRRATSAASCCLPTRQPAPPPTPAPRASWSSGPSR